MGAERIGVRPGHAGRYLCQLYGIVQNGLLPRCQLRLGVVILNGMDEPMLFIPKVPTESLSVGTRSVGAVIYGGDNGSNHLLLSPAEARLAIKDGIVQMHPVVKGLRVKALDAADR